MVLAIGVFGLIRGHLRPLRLPNRKAAGAVVAGGVVLFIIGVMLEPAAAPQAVTVAAVTPSATVLLTTKAVPRATAAPTIPAKAAAAASPTLAAPTATALPPTPTTVPPTATSIPPTATAVPPTATPKPMVFNGKGQQATPKFTLQHGLAIFRMTHNGHSNFAMTLLDNKGSEQNLLANTIGSFNGAKAFGVPSTGQYIVNVDADGSWTLTVSQPKIASAPGVPRTFTGKGQQVSPFFMLDGLTTFHLKHDGQSNFAVTLLDANGQEVSLLANDIGAFNGSKATAAPKGVYLLNIDADGNWTITVQ